MNKQTNAITVAMVKDPNGSSWQAQIHIHYKGPNESDVKVIEADNPVQLLQRAANALDKKLNKINGNLVVIK